MLPRRTVLTAIAVVVTIVLTNAFGAVVPELATAMAVLQGIVLIGAIASLLLRPPRPPQPPQGD